MVNANDKQIGGTHYMREDKPQHWDLMASIDAGYFPARLTAYVERHAKKKGREDLEKAVHFAEKMCEIEAGRARDLPVVDLSWDNRKLRVYSYIRAASLDPYQAAIFSLALLHPTCTKDILYLTQQYLDLSYPASAQPVRDSESAAMASYAGRMTGAERNQPLPTSVSDAELEASVSAAVAEGVKNGE